MCGRRFEQSMVECRTSGPPDAVLTLAERFDKREIARARWRSASCLYLHGRVVAYGTVWRLGEQRDLRVSLGDDPHSMPTSPAGSSNR